MGPPTDQEVKRALDAFLRRVQMEFAGCKVILFGSRARGDHLLTSDVDLVLVSPSFEGRSEDDRMVRALELWDGPVSLQPLCFTPGEFEERRRGINVIAVAATEGRALT